MKLHSIAAAVATLVSAAMPATASAVIIPFSGSTMNINSAAVADAACSPLLKLAFGPANTSGSSNFGAFTYQQTHCTTGGPGPYGGGQFTYFFGQGDQFSGTYSGLASASGTTGVLNNVINLVITGGTGRFLGGTGTITGAGTVDFRGGPPVQALSLSGSLDLLAVPEPATWAMMISGFGMISVSMRVHRRSQSIFAMA